MIRRKHSPGQVINELRQTEVAIAEGCTVAEPRLVCRLGRRY